MKEQEFKDNLWEYCTVEYEEDFGKISEHLCPDKIFNYLCMLIPNFKEQINNIKANNEDIL